MCPRLYAGEDYEAAPGYSATSGEEGREGGSELETRRIQGRSDFESTKMEYRKLGHSIRARIPLKRGVR